MPVVAARKTANFAGNYATGRMEIASKSGERVETNDQLGESDSMTCGGKTRAQPQPSTLRGAISLRDVQPKAKQLRLTRGHCGNSLEFKDPAIISRRAHTDYLDKFFVKYITGIRARRKSRFDGIRLREGWCAKPERHPSPFLANRLKP